MNASEREPRIRPTTMNRMRTTEKPGAIQTEKKGRMETLTSNITFIKEEGNRIEFTD